MGFASQLVHCPDIFVASVKLLKTLLLLSEVRVSKTQAVRMRNLKLLFFNDNIQHSEDASAVNIVTLPNTRALSY